MIARGAPPRLALAVILAGAIAWVLLDPDGFDPEGFDPATIEARVRSFGPWVPAAFVAAWAVFAVLLLPGAVLGLAGGALFGPVWGTAWNLLGATLGATLAFLAARYIASDWVARVSGGRLKRLIEGVEAEGWRFVAFTRLVPLFPFNLLNYALGLTRIRLSHYVITTLVCMLPGTVAYTYLGYAGREAAAGGEALIQKGLLALGLLAFVAFLPRLVRRLRSAGDGWIEARDLKHRLGRDEGVLVLDVRGREEFAGPLGHIPGARNIAAGILLDRLGQLGDDRSRPIAVVCKTDRRSAAAARALRDAGFRDVSVLRGGLEEWRRKGFAVEERGPADQSGAEK